MDLRDPVSVSFGNVKDGYRLRSPFLVEFGIRGMGVVPAGNAHDKAGHHHLLVNKALPVNHRDKIPFDDSHRHFGKGQTSTALDLAPGKHTLRLLFADHEHRPHFVFSREITVHVLGKRDGANAPQIDERNFDATCAAWYQDALTTPRTAAKEVYAKNVRDGEQVLSPLRLGLGVVGYGIAPLDKPVKGHRPLRAHGAAGRQAGGAPRLERRPHRVRARPAARRGRTATVAAGRRRQAPAAGRSGAADGRAAQQRSVKA